MPKAILDKLPASARKIYEDAWQEAKSRGWDDEKAAKYAIGAVKQAGFRKNESTDSWGKMEEAIHTSFVLPVYLSEWLEVACTGSVTDMKGHGVSITEDDLDEWVRAYDENRRGQDLPITYDHPKSGGVAAGWVRGLKKGPMRSIMGKPRTTLLMKPEWTPSGKQSVDNGDYQYFSVEILPDNQLRAVSLVNFPAIKGLKPATAPISLGEGPVYLLKEFTLAEEPEKGTKKLAKCPECGAPVPDGAKACPACGADMSKEEKPMADENKKESLSESQLNELQAELQQLQEERNSLSAKVDELTKTHEGEGQEVKSLAEKVKAQQEQIAGLIELNNMLRLHEKVVEFMVLEETPNRRIAPAYEEPITKVLLLAENLDVEAEILDLLKALASGEAVVELGERGTGAIPTSELNEGPDVDRTKLHEQAVKLSQEKGIKYTEALMELSRKGSN